MKGRTGLKWAIGLIATVVLIGVAGVIYAVIVARRMSTQTAYSPVFEDQLFHFLLPLVAYAALGSSRVRNSPGGKYAFGTENSRAISRIGASSTSEITTHASARSSPEWMRSRIARQLLPLPDPRIPIANRFTCQRVKCSITERPRFSSPFAYPFD